MGADSVLVNAAMKLGMSRVPGDTSEIFNKQYEGLIAYNQAKASATVEAVKLGGVLAQKGVNAIGTAIANKEAEKTYGKEGTSPDADKLKEAQDEIGENKQAKKGKLQGVTDILYGTKKDKDKQADYDAQLQLYKDKLDAKLEHKSADRKDKDQRPYKTDDDKWKTSDQLLQESRENKNETNSIFGSSFGSQLGGGGGGLSNPSLIKKLSPLKQQTEETKSTNTTKRSASATKSTNQSPVEEKIPTLQETDAMMNEMATDLAVDSIVKTNDHYKEGGGMSDFHFQAADTAMNNIKDGIYNIINQNSISKEDKFNKNLLEKNAQKLQKGIVNYKGLVIKTAAAYAENHVNADLSFKGLPNEQMLIKQIMDPNGNGPKLGIRARWEDGELFYNYGDSQIFREYANNKGIEINEELLEAQPTKSIRATDLLNMVVMKDLKTENDLDGVITKAGEDAIATLGNTNKLLNPDYSRIQDSIKNDFRNILESKTANLQDVFTRDIMVGNTKVNYKKDLLLNPSINSLTYADLGLTDSIDENGDGILSSDELTDSDKAIVIETLTNPRTSDQKEAAIEEATNYFNMYAAQAFNHIKNVNKTGTEKTVDDYLGEISA